MGGITRQSSQCTNSCNEYQKIIASLRRNTSNSGLIGVNWKRKIGYKNTHLKQLVDSNRVIDGLEYLIENNPLYKDSEIDRNFIDTCKSQDPSGHKFFLSSGGTDNEAVGNDGLNSEDEMMFLDTSFDEEATTPNVHLPQSDSDENEIDRQDREYHEYAKTDSIRRFQFDYDEHVALTCENPVAALDGNLLTKSNQRSLSDENQFADVAPGEGQIPVSVLKEKLWDIKTYPHLYPDGKNGMNAEERKVRLTHQQYLKQRLFNVDTRYASDPAYLFSATSFIEHEQLERNISMSYQHGTKKVGDENSRTYQVKNPYCVFKKISNTPEYWKTKKWSCWQNWITTAPFNFFLHYRVLM